MKISIRIIFGATALALLPAAAQAQATPPAAMQHEEMTGMSGWKELDAFHTLLAQAWHPIAKNEYGPARANATALVKAAEAWRRSRGPATCDTPAMRTGLTSMIESSRWYEDAATRPASDDAVKVTLKTTHDRFEEFAEPCMMHGMQMGAPKKP